ncbi:hypothetical protein QE399_002184 [Paracidovorax wautersii]|uniref:Uncharacterized protein n=1 Tax=Paracidovorax wautersii TaxID=1177982 RepID=A0ABU1IB81_9BURK|nr:hypothetical protein [Paracidovorax wautersii]
MTTETTPGKKPVPPKPTGPLEWRRIVEWLRADGVISE